MIQIERCPLLAAGPVFMPLRLPRPLVVAPGQRALIDRHVIRAVAAQVPVSHVVGRVEDDVRQDRLQAPVELSGATQTRRERINAQDARPSAEFSQDLVEWFDLEEGVHYQLADESVNSEMRTRVLELLPTVPTQRFFRLRFE